MNIRRWGVKTVNIKKMICKHAYRVLFWGRLVSRLAIFAVKFSSLIKIDWHIFPGFYCGENNLMAFPVNNEKNREWDRKIEIVAQKEEDPMEKVKEEGWVWNKCLTILIKLERSSMSLPVYIAWPDTLTRLLQFLILVIIFFP